jgi:multidrug efflux pump subunit AcrB
MFVVLFSRYRSVTLSVLIMVNMPLALLDTFLTPALFGLFGRKAAERLMADRDAGAL